MEDGVLPKKKGRPLKNTGSAPYKVCIGDRAGSNEIRIPAWVANRLRIEPRTKGSDGSITGTKLGWAYKSGEKDSLTIKAGGDGTRYSHRKLDSIYTTLPMGLARQYGFMPGTWVAFTVDIESKTAKITKTKPGKPPRRIRKDWIKDRTSIQNYERQAKEANDRAEHQKLRADYLEGILKGGVHDVSGPEYWTRALLKHVKIDPKILAETMARLFTTNWWASVYFVLWAVDTYTGWTPVTKYYFCDILIPEYIINSFANRNQDISDKYNGVINHAQAWSIKPREIEKTMKEYKKSRGRWLIINNFASPFAPKQAAERHPE